MCIIKDNVLHYKTISLCVFRWYKNHVLFFSIGMKVSLKLKSKIIMNKRNLILQTFDLEKSVVFKVPRWCEIQVFLFQTC